MRQYDRSEKIPFVITQDKSHASRYSVKLAGIELNMHLLSGGLGIEFASQELESDQPQITLTFAPGAVDFDLDVTLRDYLMGNSSLQQLAEAQQAANRADANATSLQAKVDALTQAVKDADRANTRAQESAAVRAAVQVNAAAARGKRKRVSS